jgi:MFS transporter, SET family, sugar efflux transporter
MQESIKGRVGLSTSLMDLVQVVSMLIASAVFALLTDGSSYAFVFMAAGVVSFSGAAVILMSRFSERRRPAAVTSAIRTSRGQR